MKIYDIKAALIDMDGTLVQSSDAVEAVIQNWEQLELITASIGLFDFFIHQ